MTCQSAVTVRVLPAHDTIRSPACVLNSFKSRCTQEAQTLHDNAFLLQMLHYITLHTLPTKNTVFWIVTMGQTCRKLRTRCTEAYYTQVH